LQPDQTVPIAGVVDYQGISGTCDVWRDLAISDSADILFRFDDPMFHDRAVISRNRVGAGQVIYVAGGVDSETLDRVIGDLVTESGLPGFRTPDGLEWYERSGPDGRIALALNHSHHPVSFRGRDLGPYESRVVRL
jgi:beta-galactosidase